MARLPPFMALRALEAACRLRSYSRAAAELNVTHGAVSHQIRRLEEDFGLRLFRREGNAMIPSEAASRLAARVAQAMLTLRDGVEEIGAHRPARTLVISTLQSFANRWLTPRLPGFIAAAPDLEIEVRGDERIADFVSDGVDVAIRYGAGGWPGVEAERLFSVELTPVCAPALVARYGLNTPQDLARAPLLRQRHRAWSLWFKTAGLPIEEPESGMILDDTDMLLQAAVGGLGVALAPQPLVEHDLLAGRLVRPFADSTGADWAYFLVWRADSPKRAQVARFREWITAEAARARADAPAGIQAVL